MSKPNEMTLYNGEVHLKRGGNHVYRATIEGGKSYPVPNVTSIIGVKDKSRALMPWQASVISFVVGEKVGALIDSLPGPGVKFSFTDDSHAAMVRGLSELQRTCLTATDDIRDRAGDEGTLVHAYIESYFKARLNGDSKSPPMRGISGAGKRALRQFAQWVVDHEVEPVAIERPVFSRQHFYCGQTDLILKVNGEVGVWDVKSGKSVYGEVLMQTAAYRAAWNEEATVTEEMPAITAPGGVLFFPREDVSPVQKVLTGDFEVVPIPGDMLDASFDAFLACQAVKKWDGTAWKAMKDARP